MILRVLLFFFGGGGFFVCCCCCVCMLLCCYVVKLAKAKKQPKNNKKNNRPQKMEGLPCILNMASYVCMCKSYFWGGVTLGVCLPFWSQTTIKIGFFENLKTRFSALGCQRSSVNNLATYKSITWPHFCQHF